MIDNRNIILASQSQRRIELIKLLGLTNIVCESHKVDETDRQNLRDVGFNDADIWDITNIIAFFNMSNRVASALNMKPNDDYHAKAR